MVPDATRSSSGPRRSITPTSSWELSLAGSSRTGTALSRARRSAVGSRPSRGAVAKVTSGAKPRSRSASQRSRAMPSPRSPGVSNSITS